MSTITLEILMAVLFLPFVPLVLVIISKKDKEIQKQREEHPEARVESVKQDGKHKPISRLTLPPDLYGLFLINSGKGKQNDRIRKFLCRAHSIALR